MNNSPAAVKNLISKGNRLASPLLQVTKQDDAFLNVGKCDSLNVQRHRHGPENHDIEFPSVVTYSSLSELASGSADNP
jgi:hypothetical protein